MFKMKIHLKSSYKKWCVVLAGILVLFFLDTILQYNVVSSMLFKDSNTAPHEEKPIQQQIHDLHHDLHIHPRRLQEVEDEFFEVKLKHQIDVLSSRINTDTLHKPEDNLRTDFGLKDIFVQRSKPGQQKQENAQEKKPTQVLLNSYLRGGSALLVDLVNKQRDTFYIPEPIWTVTPFGYFTADNYICSSKTGHCRALKRTVFDSDEEPDYEMKTLFRYAKRKEFPLDSVLRILHNIFTCQFDEGFDALPMDDLPYTNLGHSLRQYVGCRQGPTKTDCLNVLTNTCKEHNFRVAKVVRLTVASIEQLLQMNPDVKVVHLFRDPRAIIASRLYNADWYRLQKSPRDPSITQNARALCHKMKLDFKNGVRLMQLYPDRFRFARYEDLMSNYGNSQKRNLLKFLKIDPDMTKLDTYKSEFDWRIRMSFKDVRLVDDECHVVYDDVGYLKFKSTNAMRNLKIESFTSL